MKTAYIFPGQGSQFPGMAKDLYSHSVLLSMEQEQQPDMVAGHSLGEFSALVAAGAMDWEDGLRLVAIRAREMQKCCEKVPGTMAAIIKLGDDVIEQVCAGIPGVVPANYNSPGQVVISGEEQAIDTACEQLKAAGAKRAIKLPVSGAFHSPLMEPARTELASVPFTKTSLPRPLRIRKRSKPTS